jgi:hypothetical protein
MGSSSTGALVAAGSLQPFVRGCWVTLASNSIHVQMEEADRGVNFEWVWWESKRPLTALQVSEPKTTSAGWVFDFCNTCWFWVFEKFQNQRTASSRYLKKNPIQIIAGFGYFEKLQKIVGFHERTGKDPEVLGQCLIFFSICFGRCVVICNRWVFEFLKTMVIYQNQVFFGLITKVTNFDIWLKTQKGF